ncbi:hypothetical protein DFH08DRAFT_979147 [Mycena albidolilacea]|uniref:Uncharacterized protein n=1 Tax=Mycena albidolilacea TaxID=1033008 RepID=A0AAD7E7N3_9AGAR|nr:hypothetical protein DFH08DRAFT_979147 [Mycena albidolilacea]
MDFLFVSDSSGVELWSGWMNGTNLINTAAMAIANNVPFPKLPSVNTFLINNYTLAPLAILTFPDLTGCNEPEVPLLLYVADAPYSAYSNATTLVGACGSILRSLERLGQVVPDRCKLCFESHCWQGEMETGTPPFVAPALLLSPNTTFAEWNVTTWQPAFSEKGTASNPSAGIPENPNTLPPPSCGPQVGAGHLVTNAALSVSTADSTLDSHAPVIIGLLAASLVVLLGLLALVVMQFTRRGGKIGISGNQSAPRYVPVHVRDESTSLNRTEYVEAKRYSDD